MTHPLDGPRLKIRRAVSQLQLLRELEESWARKTDYQIVRAEFNPKTQKRVYRASGNSQPPLSWGVLIGEIAHNLRSALDGLIWQLALLNLRPSETPTSHTQFPVELRRRNSRTDGKFRQSAYFDWRVRDKKTGRWKTGIERGTGRWMIQDLKPEHQALVEKLQPYQPGRGGRLGPLWLLHDVNIADKHQTIQGVTAANTWIGEVIEGRPEALEVTRPVILKDGAKLGETSEDMTMHPTITPLVAFWKGCDAVKGYPVILTLSIFAKHAFEIVEGFAPEFS